MSDPALVDKVLSRTVIRANGCVEWTGGTFASGYGRVHWEYKSLRPHRVTYEAFVGPLPDYDHDAETKVDVDHLCRNKICVAPAHLEAVTHRVNVLRGTAPTARNARKTHCKRGHPLDDENTGVVVLHGDVKGRRCKRCAVAATQRYYAKKGR